MDITVVRQAHYDSKICHPEGPITFTGKWQNLSRFQYGLIHLGNLHGFACPIQINLYKIDSGGHP